MNAAEAIGTRPVRVHPTPLSEIAAMVGVSHDGTDPAITGITLATSRVQPGDLYAALPGTRAHGASYAGQAVAAGAVAVLTDADGAALLDVTVPVLVVDRPRSLLGELAARIYGEPAAELTLIAVTGTQGKTTTTRLLEAGLTATGIPAGVIGTVGTRIAGRDVKTSLTTPEAPDLHALFAVMREQGVRVCAMEVSSHALVLGRVDGAVFDVACFTNLGRDHLDFHPTVEDYFAAKATLFTPERAKRGVVNADDEHGRRLLADPQIPTVSFSATGADADWRAVDVVTNAAGATFTVRTPSGDAFPAEIRLAGDFNVANALCAIAAAGEAGLDPRVVAAGLAQAQVPGRLEAVEVDGQNFTAIVDYAHKPDAVEAALAALRPLTEGKLIIVIGAGGDRDQGKRPIMAEAAARLADVVVITDDNPRSEDPAVIRAAMLAGVPAALLSRVHEVGDRRAAIAYAVGVAGAGDVVLVAGKGHESGQEIDGEVHPFDDRDVLAEEITRALGARP